MPEIEFILADVSNSLDASLDANPLYFEEGDEQQEQPNVQRRF